MIHESSRPLYRGTQVVWYILFIIESMLLLRFILKALQANPEAVFTNFVYAVSHIFVVPFATVFTNMSVASAVFEWTTLLAMVIYWLIAWAVIKLIIMSKEVSVHEADQRLAE